MTRYYLRLVLWMIAVLIAATTSVVVIFSGLQERYYRPDLAEQLVGLERELERVLGGKTAEEADDNSEKADKNPVYPDPHRRGR